ncbi:MAG: hypothetical protein HPY71_11940 [Firmicutes bacterium]|nr:hypothetical protein [Bacillota bacterium]
MKTYLNRMDMNVNVKWTGIIRLACILLLIATLGGAAAAAEPPKERQRVYGLNLFDGLTYQSTFCPRAIDTIYMMAGKDNLVNPLITDVYYWPITQEYMGSWFDYKKDLKGELEIWQGDKKVVSIAPVKYVFYYPKGPYDAEMKLMVGAEAEAKYKDYKAEIDKYYKKVMDYYDQQSKYQEAIGEYIKNPKKFKSVPRAPEQPVPPSYYVTDPQETYIINLPVGTYEMQFVEHKAEEKAAGEKGGPTAGKKDEKPEPEPKGTFKKKLVVFVGRRHGMGYEIIPEEKWTMPSKTDEPKETMYMQGKRALFLKAFDEAEYNELYYTKLTKLQFPLAGRGRENNWIWVHHRDRNDVKLQILKDGKVISTVESKPYRVDQTPGYALGYKIVEFDPKKDKDKQPSFEAYKVEVDAGSNMQIRMVGKDGNVIPESVRGIKAINEGAVRSLYILSAIPILLGLAVIFWRRSLGAKARSSKSVSAAAR